jgi:hypothetical protein
MLNPSQDAGVASQQVDRTRQRPPRSNRGSHATRPTEDVSRELAEVNFANPYCRIGDLVMAGIAKRKAASVYLKILAEQGLLQ